MKKVLLFCGVLIMGAAVSSCSKDETCVCTASDGTKTEIVIEDGDAKESCAAIQAVSRIGDPGTTCKLD